METIESQRKRLKESFKKELKWELVSILKLIENRTEIEESYITEAAKATDGLIKIAKMEGEVSQRIILQNLLKALKSKRIEQREKDLKLGLDSLD